MTELIELDKELLLTINGSNSIYLDKFMITATDTITWLPFFVVLLYLVFKSNNLSKTLLILALIGLTVLVADQFSSSFCKPFFARFRPSQDPELIGIVKLVDGYKGGNYGFFSSHASNTISVALFLSLIIKNIRITIGLFIWSILACITRLYLGVHFPGDILFGILWGIIVGLFFYFLYYKICLKMNKQIHTISSQYTSSGYYIDDINVVVLTLLLNYMVLVIYSFMIL